jgi:hypothetical protein
MKIHFCMGLLYGRAGRLTALSGGFRPGQVAAFYAAPRKPFGFARTARRSALRRQARPSRVPDAGAHGDVCALQVAELQVSAINCTSHCSSL